MSEPYIAIQVVMMPSDTNPHGTIFGGVILSHIDLAGATAARREILKRGGVAETIFVTVAINRVEFTKPVYVGDVVRFQTTVERIGRTSITMRIHVIAQRGQDDVTVTDAEVVYVGILASDPNRTPVPLLPDTV